MPTITWWTTTVEPVAARRLHWKEKCYRCPVSNSINKMFLANEKKKFSVDSNQTRHQFQDSRSRLLWLSRRRQCRVIFVRQSCCDRLSARTSSNQLGNFTLEPHEPPPLAAADYGGSGRLEVRRAVFLRVTPAFCAPPHIVPYALSEQIHLSAFALGVTRAEWGTRLISLRQPRHTAYIWYGTFEWILQITMPSIGPNKPSAPAASLQPSSSSISFSSHMFIKRFYQLGRQMWGCIFKPAW